MLVRPPKPCRAARLLAVAALCVPVLAASVAAGAILGPSVPASRVAQAASVTPADGLPVRVTPEVERALERRLSVDGRRATREALERKGDYEAMIAEVLDSRGLPTELIAMVLVESGFRNGVRPDASSLRGAGLWQFIPSTARRYGLTVEPLHDERLEPRRATEAAALLLADLHARYGDWELALAGYYHGADAVDRAIAAGGTRDALELERRGLLEPYASKVLAAVIVMRDPALLD